MSLLELLVGMAIVAITAALAIPSFETAFARNHLAISSNSLLAALLSARQTAIARNTSVAFCAGNPQEGCHGDWTLQEWIVFVDRDRDGELDQGEMINIVERMPAMTRISITGNGPFGKAVVFRPDGLAKTTSGAFAAGRLRICVTRRISENATDLVLIGSGRVVSEAHDFDGSCPLPGGQGG